MSRPGTREQPLRWGFAGPGRIAHGVARDLALLDEGVLHAVGSRSLDRARAFAAEHGAAVAHGSYAALLADPDVDAVYIATPHRQHHALALAAIAAGKHLLIEKAFTSTLAGAQEVVEAARAAGVFCMEAMWTRFQPAVRHAAELWRSGALGEVRSVRADLGLVVPPDPTNRLWDPERAGGAVLDLGVYPVSWLQFVLGGSPQRVEVAGPPVSPGSVDVEATVLWLGEAGRQGVASCSLVSTLPGTAAVHGTAGWLEIPPRFHHPDRVVRHPLGPDGRPATPEVTTLPPTGTGYSHELAEVHRCVAAGLTESPVMPLADTLSVMAVLEHTLHALDVHFTEAPLSP